MRGGEETQLHPAPMLQAIPLHSPFIFLLMQFHTTSRSAFLISTCMLYKEILIQKDYTLRDYVDQDTLVLD